MLCYTLQKKRKCDFAVKNIFNIMETEKKLRLVLTTKENVSIMMFVLQK